MKNLVKRLIISAVFVSLTIVTIFFASHWIFFIVVEALILLALYEFFSLVEKKGLIIHRGFGLFFGAILPFSVYSSMQLTILFMACLSIFLFLFNRRSPDKSIVSVAMTIFGIVYVAWFFSYLIKVRVLPDGAAWAFYVILIVKGGDAGAYFIGSKFGKRKLIPHISPNKSVEGAIGQLVTTIILSLISASFLPAVSFMHLFVMGTVVGVLAQLGDLAESLLKRDAEVKDSGELPGLGGMLDILDSLLFTLPFVYFYLIKIVRIAA